MPKIILVTHQKGGIGKSTLTFNLAQNISKSIKVAVLDFDLQGSLSQLKELVTDFDIIPFNKEIKEISQLDYDFIFIDTPPYLSNHLTKLIELADLIVVPTKAGALDLLVIKSTIELIQQENKKQHSLIVFNMVILTKSLHFLISNLYLFHCVKLVKKTQIVYYTALFKRIRTENKYII